MTVIELKQTAMSFADPQASRSFIAAAKAAANACAPTDWHRDTIQMIQVTFGDGEIKLVSTNTYRAVRIRIPVIANLNDTQFYIYGHELLSALPKASDFKLSGDTVLTIGYEPGKARLDPGEFKLGWGNNMRSIYARPEVDWPNIEQLIDANVNTANPTNETIGLNPKFLADIAKEAASLTPKDAPVRFHLGSTPLQAVRFSTNTVDVGSYECLLMPVRLSS